MGFGHFMQMKLGDAEERFIYLFISFRENAPEHERLYDELFRLLALLAPHILRAARMARAMRMSREASRLLGGALDTVILPMAVVDASGALIFANAAGRRCIDRGGLLSTDAEGRLTLPTPHETRGLRARLREIDAAGRPGGLRAHEGDEPFSLLVMPFVPALDRAGQLDGALHGARRAFAVFVGQTEDDAIDAGLLADVFDLTLREAAVCRDLLRGLSPAEIAAASGRSPKTVRNQVQAIHDKLGVASHRALFDRLATFRAVSHVFSGVERGAGPEVRTPLAAAGPRPGRPRPP